MDDVLKRLGALESLSSESRADISAIKAVLPHLATKGDIGEVKAAISAAETRLTRWMVGTLFLAASAAFGLAKLVN